MWATLAQAINRTNATAPSSTSSPGRTSPTTVSSSERTVTSRLVPGNSLSSRPVIVAISARACSSATPGLRRANTRRLWPPRLAARSPSASGAHSSVCVSQNGGNWNSRGMTPTTVYGSPFNVTGRPRTFGSPPKRRCQSRWLRMTSCSRPGSVSSGRNRRPRAGCTPSIGSTSSVRRTAWMLSGSSVPVRFGVQLSAAPMLSNTVFCRRQSTKFAGATGLLPRCSSTVSSPGARYGRGRRSTALTTLKIAVLAPMPSARASTAAAVKAGVRARARAP